MIQLLRISYATTVLKYELLRIVSSELDSQSNVIIRLNSLVVFNCILIMTHSSVSSQENKRRRATHKCVIYW